MIMGTARVLFFNQYQFKFKGLIHLKLLSYLVRSPEIGLRVLEALPKSGPITCCRISAAPVPDFQTSLSLSRHHPGAPLISKAFDLLHPYPARPLGFYSLPMGGSLCAAQDSGRCRVRPRWHLRAGRQRTRRKMAP